MKDSNKATIPSVSELITLAEARMPKPEAGHNTRYVFNLEKTIKCLSMGKRELVYDVIYTSAPESEGRV